MKTVASGSPLPTRMLVRPAPIGLDGLLPMESFMSWLTRLAWANGFLAAHNLLKAQRISWLVSTDVGPERRRLEILRLGGQGESALRAMSLKELLVLCGSSGEGGASSNWVLPREDGSAAVPHQVCPRCLAEQATPYWTKETRISYITQCASHHVVLLSHCPACDGQLTLHRERTTALTHCERCKLDLRSVHQWARPPSERIPRDWLDTCVPTTHPCTSGYIKKQALWKGIRAILIVLCDSNFARSLLRLSFLKDHHALLEALADGSNAPFDWHRSEQRHRMLIFAKWLIEAWNDRILAIAAHMDIRSEFIRARNTVGPNWTSGFFRREVSQRPLSPEERYASSLIPFA